MPFILVLFISLLSPLSPAWGFEVTVVQSSTALPYQQVHNSLSKNLALHLPQYGLKAVNTFMENSIVLGANYDEQTVLHKLHGQQPDLIIAIGYQALAVVSPIKDIPIFSLLVTTNQQYKKNHSNIIYFPITTRPGQGLKEIQKLLPAYKRIGVIYDPARSTTLINDIRRACPDITFITRQIHDSRAIIKQIATLQDRIDLLLLIPDLTSVTPLTESTYILFSIQQQVPLLAFTEQQLKHGASFAYVIDFATIGRQVAKLAEEMSKGKPFSQLTPPTFAPGHLLINKIVVKKLELPLPK